MKLNKFSRFVSVMAAMLVCFSAFAQTREIKGTVTNAEGVPVIGAGVVVAELQSVGAVTDHDGFFTLNLDGEQAEAAKTLTVSCLGMTTVNVAVPANGKPLTIVLQDDSNLLDELIVVAYGTTSKKDLTGSVTAVSEKQFNKGVVTSVTDLLAGQVAGLVVTKAGGDPTASATMRLRGTTSLVGGNSPLVVIDGVPDASLNLVSPEDVESVTVLKDASAAAIYGARSANGVIIVTTKKGHEGRLNVAYNGYYGVEMVANNLDMLSATEWRQYVADNNLTDTAIDYGYDTDWTKEMLRLGQSQSHSISLTGGTAKTQYRASVTYLNQKAIVINNDLQRYNANFTLSQKAMNDKLKIDLSLLATYEDWSDMSWNSSIWSYAYNLNPTMPVYNENDPAKGYFQPYGFLEYNPVSELMLTDMDKSRNYSQGHLALSYEIIDGLSANVSGSLSRNSFHSGFYTPASAESGRADHGSAVRTTSLDQMMLLEANVTYDQKFGKHKVNAVLGYSWQKYMGENFSAANRDFATDAFSYNNLGAGLDLKVGDVSSYKSSSKLISFFGRVTYDYDSRYYVTATLRRDGSSKFGANNRWGYFPSASVAWRISSEKFMRNAHWMDDLKVRVSYGVTGNEAIGNYRTMAIYGDSGYYYDAGEWKTQYAPTQNENPNLRWERTAQLAVGLDFAFFKNRLYGSVEYYNKQTSDLLYTYPVPTPPYQYGTMMANVGKISNKGFEITVGGAPVVTRNFRWDASVTFARNVNMVETLSNEEFTRDKVYLGQYAITGLTETPSILESGHPVGTFYGAKCIGVDEDGILLYEDVNGDGKFVYADDRTYIGNPQPDFTLNITSRFQLKNWFASFLLRGVFGNDIVNGTDLYLGDPSRLPGQNALKSALGRTPQTKVYSSYFIEDGSFLRLDNLQVGYEFKFKSNAIVKGLRLSITGNNLFVITKYSGIDPEVGQDGIYFGIDARNYYPKTRSVSLGLNLTL